MLQIIEKVNQIVKNGNFTKMVKSRKNAGACFLIVALGNGCSLYGSYSSDAVYFINENGETFGFRK